MKRNIFQNTKRQKIHGEIVAFIDKKTKYIDINGRCLQELGKRKEGGKTKKRKLLSVIEYLFAQNIYLVEWSTSFEDG